MSERLTEPNNADEQKTLLAEPEARLLKIDAVMERTALGRTAIYALIADGNFPKPVKLGRASRWPDWEVEAWIRSLRPNAREQIPKPVTLPVLAASSAQQRARAR